MLYQQSMVPLCCCNSVCLYLSGYLDSNQGPPAPKAGALTGLRYTPNDAFLAVQRYIIF